MDQLYPASSPDAGVLDVDVAIIGAGIAGLALAVALELAHAQRRGASSPPSSSAPARPLVRVFERDARFDQRRQGYGLTMQAAHTLEALGLLAEVRARDCASDEHWTFAPCGSVLGYFGRELRAEGGGLHRAADGGGGDGGGDDGDGDGDSDGAGAGDLDGGDNAGAGGGSVAAARVAGAHAHAAAAAYVRGNVALEHLSPAAERGNLRIPREDLRRLLLSRLPGGEAGRCVEYGARLVAMADAPPLPDEANKGAVAAREEGGGACGAAAAAATSAGGRAGRWRARDGAVLLTFERGGGGGGGASILYVVFVAHLYTELSEISRGGETV